MKFEPYERRIVKLTLVNGNFYYRVQYKMFVTNVHWMNLTDDKFPTFAAAAEWVRKYDLNQLEKIETERMF